MTVDDYNREQLSKLSEDELLHLIEAGTRALQADAKLTVDGKCGPNTREHLRAVMDSATAHNELPSSAGSNKTPIPKGRAGIASVYGTFSYTEGTKKGAIVIDRTWARKNIVGVRLASGKQVWLHRLVADEFAHLFSTACAISGYTPTRVGSWVARHILWNPAKPLSTHSWGIAVDFDAGHNKYGKKNTLIRKYPDFIAVFESAGWSWGGRWRTPDDMHFQRAAP